MSRRRPWKVRWWSQHWNDHAAATYGSRERAMSRAQAELDEGAAEVSVWVVDDKGYVVGRVERLWVPRG